MLCSAGTRAQHPPHLQGHTIPPPQRTCGTLGEPIAWAKAWLCQVALTQSFLSSFHIYSSWPQFLPSNCFCITGVMSLKFCCLCQGCLQLMISALSSAAVGQQSPTTISSPLVQTRMHVWIFTHTKTLTHIHTHMWSKMFSGVVQLKRPFTQKLKFCLSKSLTLVNLWNTNKDLCNLLSSSNPLYRKTW